MADPVYFEGDIYKRALGATTRLSPQQRLGKHMFGSILIFAAVMLCFVAAWAALTYPSIGDVMKLAPASEGTDRLQMWREAKAEWVQQLISVSQMALFGSLIPLIGTIAGYMLGQKAATDVTSEAEEML